MERKATMTGKAGMERKATIKNSAVIEHPVTKKGRPTPLHRRSSSAYHSSPAEGNGQLGQYVRVRQRTLALTEGLSQEDMLLQSMPDASPTKWHLAHTTWFFETFVLVPYLPNYTLFHPAFPYLFNSYYDAVGERHPRPMRGQLSRPSIEQVLDYRQYVDEAMAQLTPTPSLSERITLGLHHEMQHQELMLTDIKHALSLNPFAFPELDNTANTQSPDMGLGNFLELGGGLVSVGYDEDSDGMAFAYDCEQPRHSIMLQPFALANQPVTNGQWLAFMADGGYDHPDCWLADGWARRQQEQWQAPLYWRNRDGQWETLSLHGWVWVDPSAPVCHISYYEADAFARWAGCRLPTEFEWEYAARHCSLNGHFAEADDWQPRPPREEGGGLQQLYGDVWEWTQSPFMPYPGFVPAPGALSEYNGKFMANQWVLRGGSCVTPKAQIRPSYRNFFYPHQRWQFSGLRLAK